MKNNFFILTGGPGSGKTSVLEELRLHGYHCVEEVGRDIIREQIRLEGEAVPWKNIPLYTQQMLQRSVDGYKENVQKEEPVFFDRGIPDTYGYACLTEQETGSIRKIAESYRYNKTVFFFPPWEEIYCNDTERKQDFAEAVRTYEIMKDCYRELEYTIVEVPCGPVAERVDYILENVLT